MLKMSLQEQWNINHFLTTSIGKDRLSHTVSLFPYTLKSLLFTWAEPDFVLELFSFPLYMTGDTLYKQLQHLVELFINSIIKTNTYQNRIYALTATQQLFTV